jgi:rhodanese-related sulfurtransferase
MSEARNCAGAAPALELTPKEVQELIGGHEGALLVDVREHHERAEAHIAGSLHIPLGELSARAAELSSQQVVVFYCQVGARSLLAAEAFRASGYRAHTMGGGIVRWSREGHPVEPRGAAPQPD